MRPGVFGSIRVRGGVRRAIFLTALAVLAAVGAPQGAFAAPGDIHTVAGGSIGNGYSLFGTIRGAADVAYSAAGDKLYIADRVDHRVRVVSEPYSQLSTLAGNGLSGAPLGDGGPAVNARLNRPDGVATDKLGNVYIADSGHNRIRKVTPGGIISTVAGNGGFGFSGDGGPALFAEISFPRGVSVAPNGDLYIADTVNERIRKVDAATGIITTVAGGGVLPVAAGQPATAAALHNPVEVAVRLTASGAFNGFLIADIREVFGTGNSQILYVNTAGNISRFAGCPDLFVFCPLNDGAPASLARLQYPTDVSVDAAGAVYISDIATDRIRLVSPNGTINTVAGNGECCSAAGDTGPAKKAFLDSPEAAAPHPDLSGRTFTIADTGNFKIRRVSFGDIGPTVGAFGDSGYATNAWITNPRAVATDSTGLMYVIDSIGRLRKVKTPHPLAYIITLVGDEPLLGYEDAFFAQPQDVAVDSANQVFWTDTNGDRVFRLGTGPALGAAELITDAIPTPAGIAVGKSGFLTPGEATNPLNKAQVVFVASGNDVFAVSKGKDPVQIAGTGACGNGGDGAASSAAAVCPAGMAVDAFGNLYIASGSRVRKITFGPDGIFNGADDIISTVVGPLAVTIRDVSTGPAGSLYLALSDHKVARFTGPLTTIAGTGVAGFSGDGGPGTAGQLNTPLSVAYDGNTGRVYIADINNHRVRYIEP